MFRKTVLVIIGLGIFLFLILAFIFGLYSARDLKKIVSEQFNRQQLFLACQAAREIEHDLNYAIEELASLRYITQSSIPISRAFLEGIYKRVRKKGITSVAVVDIYGNPLVSVGKKLPENLFFTFKGEKLTTPLLQFFSSKGKQLLVIACPLDMYRIGVFLVDVRQLVREHVANIHSGKTGYAWVIDQEGYFIFHPINKFIGRNAFEIRHHEAPYFSFKDINILQKKMVSGEEGMGKYASLWHGEKRGHFNKLVAYAPVHLPYTSAIWSVAVCAPEQEVDAVIHRAYLRDFFLQSAVVLALILVSLFLLVTERRFSHLLKKEVARKTENLRKSEERRRLLIEGADDLIFTLDLNGNIISVNEATARFFLKSKQSLVGTSFSTLFHWSKQESAQILKQLFSTGRVINKEHIVKINGQKHWLNTKLMLLTLKKDEKEILCIARDITEIKEAEEQLVNAEKMASLGTLAAGVAHEINNPLGIIIGFGELLLENTPKETQAYQDVKLILKHALHCKSIVQNLLNFARPTGEPTETIDINQIMEEVINIVKHTLEMHNIKLEKKFAASLPPVYGDKRQLQQVFLNLIINAIDAMPKGGKLSITTQLNAHQDIEIRIQDTGYGIKEQDLGKIFDPFFTTKPEGRGTGLGLSISYSIVNKHNGHIRCESEENRGTTFIIELPPVGGHHAR